MQTTVLQLVEQGSQGRIGLGQVGRQTASLILARVAQHRQTSQSLECNNGGKAISGDATATAKGKASYIVSDPLDLGFPKITFNAKRYDFAH